MCEEKQSIRIDYIVCRKKGKRIIPTGWKRENAPACRTRYSHWAVYHNGRWMQLHRTERGVNYIVVK